MNTFEIGAICIVCGLVAGVVLSRLYWNKVIAAGKSLLVNTASKI